RAREGRNLERQADCRSSRLGLSRLRLDSNPQKSVYSERRFWREPPEDCASNVSGSGTDSFVHGCDPRLTWPSWSLLFAVAGRNQVCVAAFHSSSSFTNRVGHWLREQLERIRAG